MIVGFGVIVEEIYVNFLISHPRACNKRILKVSISHRVIIYAENLVEVHLIFFNFLFSPCGLAESSHSKYSVIEVNTGILSSLRVLLNFLDLYVLVRLTANFFLKS